MTLSGYDFVIWDWNGTLLDDAWVCLEIVNGMLSRRNLPTMDLKRYREIFDFPVADYYRRAGFDFSREPFERLADEFIGEYLARMGECALHDAVEETLARVERSGGRNVVLSASNHGTLETALRGAGIRERFLDIQGVEDHFAVSKIDMGHALLGRHAVDAGRAVLVGDTTHDYEVAVSLDVDSILVAGGHQSSDRLRSTGAPVAGSIAALFPA